MGEGDRHADAAPRLRAELDRLDGEVRAGRRRWRGLKGTASAGVAGSGVDWAVDPELRELVLGSSFMEVVIVQR